MPVIFFRKIERDGIKRKLHKRKRRGQDKRDRERNRWNLNGDELCLVNWIGHALLREREEQIL
jgi:hypothetical protein